MPMYDSTRDQILDKMSREAWDNASSGNVECPTGFFSRITIEREDIRNAIAAFGDFAFELDMRFNFDELVGYWLVSMDSAGFLTVESFPSEDELISAYDALDNEYGAWDDQGI